jgi:alpha-tubulin suppressor-like RCC1 family protein
MIALQHAGTVDEVCTVGNTRSLPRVFDIEGLQQQTLAQVTCGEDYSLALTVGGDVYAWGDANYGKLAAPASSAMPTDDDNLPYQPLPALVTGFGGCRIVQLACGSNHSLALTEGGRVWAWGGAIFGRLGPSMTTDMPLDEDQDPYQPTPVLVEGFGQERVRAARPAASAPRALSVVATARQARGPEPSAPRAPRGPRAGGWAQTAPCATGWTPLG